MSTMDQLNGACNAALSTMLSASAGGFTVLVHAFYIFNKLDCLGLCNGALSGLVAASLSATLALCGPAPEATLAHAAGPLLPRLT